MRIDKFGELVGIARSEIFQASELWQRDPAQVSDRQLKILATFAFDKDERFAATAWEKREAARVKAARQAADSETHQVQRILATRRRRAADRGWLHS